jgi:hypothetical protein
MANQDDQPIIMDPAQHQKLMDSLHVTVPSGPIVGDYVDRAKSPLGPLMEGVANLADPFNEEALRRLK